MVDSRWSMVDGLMVAGLRLLPADRCLMPTRFLVPDSLYPSPQYPTPVQAWMLLAFLGIFGVSCPSVDLC